MKPGLWRYLKAAFNARPLGMFIAPNWIGLAAFGLLGLLNPGFWALGAGVELVYLYVLVQNARFRRHIDSGAADIEAGRQRVRVDDALRHLDSARRGRFDRLSARCQAILDAQPEGRAGLDVQRNELGRLLWMYLKLLRTGRTLEELLREAGETDRSRGSLARRIEELERSLRDAPSDELRRSLEAQIEILRQRSARQDEARRRSSQVDADLARIEQQVELLREETMLTTDTAALHLRIDAVSGSLTETVQWVREQEDIHGDIEDLVDEAPPLLRDRRERHS